MRMISRFNRWSRLAQSGALLAAVTYILQPVSASAAAVKVCASAGDACSSFINKYVQPAILLLTASIGVFAVISYIVVAIQYSSAGDDPSAVSKAKNRAFKTTIGLIAYFFLFAFLNFLVPGGLF